MAELTRTRFTLAESARVRGGSILVRHSHLCASHYGGECQCDPRYALRRQPRDRRGR
jgi:hypothetical protein